MNEIIFSVDAMRSTQLIPGVSLSLFVLSKLNMTRVHKLGPQQCTLFEILITVNSVLNGLIVFNGHFIKLQ